MTRLPPALVAALPPSVAVPRAPRSSGNANCCASTASCSVCRTTPACTVAVRCCGSMLSIARMRSSERMTSPGPASAPWTSPVRPPCVTTRRPLSLHQRMTAETCSVVFGRTSAWATSVSNRMTPAARVAVSLASSTPSFPTIALKLWTTSMVSLLKSSLPSGAVPGASSPIQTATQILPRSTHGSPPRRDRWRSSPSSFRDCADPASRALSDRRPIHFTAHLPSGRFCIVGGLKPVRLDARSSALSPPMRPAAMASGWRAGCARGRRGLRHPSGQCRGVARTSARED